MMEIDIYIGVSQDSAVRKGYTDYWRVHLYHSVGGTRHALDGSFHYCLPVGTSNGRGYYYALAPLPAQVYLATAFPFHRSAWQVSSANQSSAYQPLVSDSKYCLIWPLLQTAPWSLVELSSVVRPAFESEVHL